MEELGRKHGDPFPLCSSGFEHAPSQVGRMRVALDKLAGTEFTHRLQQLHRPPTVVQHLVDQRLNAAFEEAGECPKDLVRGQVLNDMMKSHNLYDEEPSNLAHFDKNKLKILRSNVSPKPLESLLPPHIIPVVRNFKTMIERSNSEAVSELEANPGCCPHRPYWDPTLQKDEHVRADLVASLYNVGVVGFRRRIKAAVGLFFVKKKTPDAIRMVVDCRISNHYHHRPPITRLGSAGAFAELDLSDEALNAHFGASMAGDIGYGCEMDVSDCFYQFTLDALASWFGINMGRPCSYWRKLGIDLQSVFDDDLGYNTSVTDDTLLFPVIQAVPMGWSWALFLANEAVAWISRMTQPEKPLEFREKTPTPQLWECDSIVSTYVDNVSVIGGTRDAVEKRVKLLDEAFQSHNIPVVWTYSEPQRVFETIGLIVDFQQRVVRNKPKRIWKVHLAGLELCRRSKVRVETVEVWLGHATSLFRLSPHLLSIFFDIYRFVRINSGKRVNLWPSVRKEIMLAVDLVWLARAELGGSHIHQVDMGDSATNGYALMTRWCSINQLQSISRHKEKWRFQSMPEYLQAAISGLNDGSDPDFWRQRFVEACDRAGVGLETEYGKWLQEFLVEGSWLRTSSIMTQYKATRKRRVEVDVGALVPPIPEGIVSSSKFDLLWSRRWRNPDEHINVKEGRVILSSLKRTCRVGALFGGRKVTLSDNLSAVMAFSKGRSSRFSMNRLCRGAAALIGATGVKWSLRHIETKRNVADAPSRRFERKHRKVRMSSKMQPPNSSQASRDGNCRTCQYDEPVEHTGVETTMGPGDLQTSQVGSRTVLSLSDIVPPPGLTIPASGCEKFPTCGSLRAKDSCPLLGDSTTSEPAPTDVVVENIKKKKTVKPKQQQLAVWEIFSGDGYLSQAFSSRGHHVLRPVDILGGSGIDVRKRSVQQIILYVIRDQLIQYIHFGTPCTVFSRARRNITNISKARRKEIDGCILASFTVEACILACRVGVAWSIENPASSRIWEHPDFLILRSMPGVFMVYFDQCEYGTDFKKPTYILTNLQGLQKLERRCRHFKHSVVLSGTTKVDGVWRNRTALASSYPHKLCSHWVRCAEDGLTNAETKFGTDFGSVIQSLDKANSSSYKESADSLQRQGSSAVPAIIDSVVFGQHSKAEADKRRRLRRSSKWFKQKVSKVFGHRSGGSSFKTVESFEG